MAKDSNVLSPTDRKSWNKLIDNRVKTMIQALDTQLGAGVDQIIADLRRNHSIQFTEVQLDSMIRTCDEQIKEAINQHVIGIKKQIQVEIEESNDTFDREERAMKERHKAEWDALQTQKKNGQNALKERLRNAEEEAARVHTADLLNKKKEHVRELNRVREIEMKITSEADARYDLMRQHKDRLRNHINDAGNRAVEQLMMISTKDEAQALLQSIPTVAEAVEMCRSKDGLNSLLNRLTTPLLSGPVQQPIKVEVIEENKFIDVPLTDVTVEIPTTDDIEVETTNYDSTGVYNR